MPTSGFGVGYSVMNSDNRQAASLAFLWPALAAETASEFAAAMAREFVNLANPPETQNKPSRTGLDDPQ